jgi:carbamoyltransferase
MPTPQPGAKPSEYLAWSQERSGTYLPTEVAYDGALYVLSDTGILSRFDAKTGAMSYRSRLEAGGAFTSSPWAYNGKIFCLSEEGKTFVVKAGDQAWRAKAAAGAGQHRAALLVDGTLVAAVEEERLNRIKHGKQAEFDNPHQLPERAIRFCLNYAGLTAGDIGHVAYSFDPKLRRTRYRAEWWDPRLEETFRLRLGQVRGAIEELLGRSLGQRLHFVPHHLAHAASAYFPSGFDHAAILTIDGLGETAGSSLAKAVGTRIQSVETFEYPHSIGFLWEVFSGYLGFSHYDASKVMGLAAYGNPDVFRQQFLSILRTDEVNYGVAQEFLGVHPDRFARMEAMFGPPRDADSEILPRHADMAAALQAATDAAVAALVRRVKRRVPFDNLCLAGGVALNCVTNELVRRSGEFSNVFIPSAPHDAGTAIGAAFAVHCATQKRPPQRGNYTPYLGPAFKRRDILAAVKSAGLTADEASRPCATPRT